MRKSLFSRRDAASRKSTQSRVRNAAEMGSRWPLTLACLEAAMRLVDDVDAPFAAYDAVVAVTTAQRFQRIADFHGSIPLSMILSENRYTFRDRALMLPVD
jgi:hypothetical protein